MRYLEQANPQGQKGDEWLPGSMEGRSRETLLMLLVGVGENDENILKLNSGNGCTTL